MRHTVSGVVALVVLSLAQMAAASAAGPPAAQPHRPSGSGTQPEGWTIETLAWVRLDALPPVPARVSLARQTFQPNVRLEGVAGGPVLYVVESGALAAAAQGALVLSRAAPAGQGEPQEATMVDGEFGLNPRDQVVFPAGTAFALRNDGRTPAEVLVAQFHSSGPGVAPPLPFGGVVCATASPLPPSGGQSCGVAPPLGSAGDASGGGGAPPLPPDSLPPVLPDLGRQVGGEAAALPPAPVDLVVTRLTLAPGARFPIQGPPAPVLTLVEAGTVGVTVEVGDVQLTSQQLTGQPSGPPPNPPGPPVLEPVVVQPGYEATLMQGDGVFFQVGSVAAGRNRDADPAVMLVMTISPVQATP